MELQKSLTRQEHLNKVREKARATRPHSHDRKEEGEVPVLDTPWIIDYDTGVLGTPLEEDHHTDRSVLSRLPTLPIDALECFWRLRAGMSLVYDVYFCILMFSGQCGIHAGCGDCQAPWHRAQLLGLTLQAIWSLHRYLLRLQVFIATKDDTEMTLALADSLSECGCIDAEHVSKTYAQYFMTPPPR